MKLILILLTLIVCVFADDWKPKTSNEIKTIRTTCVEEISPTDEEKEKMQNFIYTDEDAVRKFSLCLMVKMGLFSQREGKFYTDRYGQQYKQWMDEVEVKKLADGCISGPPKDDKEDDVYVHNIHKCIMATEIGRKIKDYVNEHKDEWKL